MSQDSVTMVDNVNSPRVTLTPENVGDKTPPYIQDENLPLDGMLDPRSPPPSSVIVKTNSFFSQSLLRELSGNSLILPSKDKNEKELVSSAYFNSKSENHNTSGQEASKEAAEKRSRIPSTESELNEPAQKRLRTITSESESEESTRESLKKLQVNQDSSPGNQTEPETESEKSSSPRDNQVTMSESQPDNIETETTKVVQSEITNIESASESGNAQLQEESETAETSMENQTAMESETIQQEEGTKTTVEERQKEESQASSEIVTLSTQANTASQESESGRKCPICGKINCPADPNRRGSGVTIFPVSQNTAVKRLNTPRKNKLVKGKTQTMKVNSRKAQLRRSINTRNLTTRRPSNSSPLPSWKKKSELFKAVEKGDSVQVQELVQEIGVAVRKDKTGCTLLHAAASHNQVDVLMFLLKQISPNITNKEGQTPGHVAAASDHIQVLRILQSDTEFDPDRKDKRHNTVKTLLNDHLFDAVMDEDKKKVERLVDIGADPDSQIRNRTKGMLARELGVSTPRHLARALNLDTVNILFKKTRPINKKNMENDSSTTRNERVMQLRSTKLAKRYEDLCIC